MADVLIVEDDRGIGSALVRGLEREGHTARWVHARTGATINVVTARDDEADRVAALDAGADDHVVKPFGFAELSARIRAMLRRTQPLPARRADGSSRRLDGTDVCRQRPLHGAAAAAPARPYSTTVTTPKTMSASTQPLHRPP